MAQVTKIKRKLELKDQYSQSVVTLTVFSTAITPNVTTTTEPAGSLAFDTTAGSLFISDGVKWQTATVAGQAVAASSSPTFAALTVTAAGTFGGGYGSTGATIATTGNISTNGTLVVDGASTLTGAVGVTGVLTAPSAVLASPAITLPTVKDLTEVVAAANVITAEETGSVFFLNSTTEFASTLPVLAAGLHFTFIVTAAPSGANYTITTNGAAANMIGQVKVSVSAGGAGQSATTTPITTIAIVDAKAVVGDKVEVYCDGTNWFFYAEAKVFDAITLS